jgi:hypothetical protein
MKYVEFKVGENEYKLRLGAQQIISVEKKLGGNVLDMFMEIENNKMPTVTDVLTVLHGSMQKYNHGITMEKIYGIYDDYVEEGKTYIDLIPVLTDVLKASGFFKDAQVEGEEEEVEAEA